MDALTAFGVFAVTAGLICYALEKRSPWFILGFAVSCALGSVYGFLQGAWPFGAIEIVWTVVALRRWHITCTTVSPKRDGAGNTESPSRSYNQKR